MWFIKGMLKVFAVGILGMIALAVVGVAIIAWDKHQAQQTANERNPGAIAAGFRDYKDMDNATKNGFADSKAWHEVELKNYEEKRTREHAEFLATHPTERMEIVNTSWKRGGIALMNFTVKNGNDYGVRDIKVNCSFKAVSGTQLNENFQTVYDRIPANSEKAFREVNLGLINTQSAGATCWVVSASRI